MAHRGIEWVKLELVSKASAASVDDIRAATSSNFAKKSSVYLSGYTSSCFARFPLLASHLANLATKLLLRPVLVKRPSLESLRERYHRAGKVAKGELLKEVQEILGCHRKHAIRAMRRRQPGRKAAGGKRGRKSRYEEPAFLKALARVRRVMEFRNADVIKENLPDFEVVKRLYGIEVLEVLNLPVWHQYIPQRRRSARAIGFDKTRSATARPSSP
jgi:hypothetical protein